MSKCKMDEAWCVRCRGARTVKDAKVVEKKVRTSMKYFLMGNCPDCGIKISKAMSKVNAEAFKLSNPIPEKIDGGWQEIQ